MSTLVAPSSSPIQADRKLRSCLSPVRASRSASPSARISTRSISSSSDNLWPRKRKCVRWEGEDSDSDVVTDYFATYSACEYDRSPLAPPSEAERSCVLPARGSRCLNFGKSDDDDEDDCQDEDEAEAEDEEYEDSDSDRPLPRSPFGTPDECDSEPDCDDAPDEWSDCFARRRMMFASLSGPREGPQFEGYRSLSSTLVDLLRSLEGEEEDEERLASREESENEDDNNTASTVSPHLTAALPEDPHSPVIGELFSRLREGSVDSEIGTPSLVSSADSDGDCSRVASPRGSAIDMLPGVGPQWLKLQAPQPLPQPLPPRAQSLHISAAFNYYDL